MGVRRFYRWLVEKYPKIVVNAMEEDENGREFDNLYLDMNEIIHPCFHPEDNDILLKELYPATYEKVFENIFEYIDRILQIVRPRKLLFMSIDGVAPRAKMNQQRTRRFRNAKDREILAKEEDRLRRQYKLKGRDLLPTDKESEVSDSNVITPGTEFMSELSKRLQTYIRLRISNHPTWKGLKVILSDANVPGEGEHKIMSFIRRQRTCPDYNPNTSHVLYGLDTDLIMLALATHEVHFSILRFRNEVNDSNGGYINLKRVEKFILAVGEYEDKIFTKRSEVHENKLRRMRSEDAKGKGEEDYFLVSTNIGGDSSCNVRSPDHSVLIVENTKMLKEELKSYAREISDLYRNGRVTNLVELGDHGWKKRYYNNKFSADTEQDMENMRKILVEKYAEGLCWVLLYYFSDVPSWTWFFPYHYGPFASDLRGLSSTKPMFRKGLPFKPFDQLMAILPPMSAHALPVPYQSLMTDEHSSIIDFYPTEFDIDTDGKTFFWEGVLKLPFIDEERLLAATRKMEKELSEEEAKRNAENVDLLFVHSSEHLALQIINVTVSVEQNILFKIDAGLSGDINGFVHLEQDSENVIDSNGLANDLDVLCVDYHPPNCCVHIPRMLDGTTIPETVASESDIEERPLWHDIQRHHRWWINRSYNHVQEAKRNHSDGFESSSCPGVIVKGGGSGWSPRGRGYNATSGTVQKERINIPSFGDTYGRGSRVNSNVHQTSRRWTDSSSDISLEQRQAHILQSTTYPAIRTNNMNDQLWSVRNAGSGFGNSQALQRWGGTQSRNDGRW